MDRRAVGRSAEAAAAQALAARGYAVVARNVRSRTGEIDLVCRDGATFVFCEVKARRPSGFGVAAEALTAVKRRRLARLAEAYLARVGRRGATFRLELAAVDLEGERPARVSVLPIGADD